MLERVCYAHRSSFRWRQRKVCFRSHIYFETRTQVVPAKTLVGRLGPIKLEQLRYFLICDTVRAQQLVSFTWRSSFTFRNTVINVRWQPLHASDKP